MRIAGYEFANNARFQCGVKADPTVVGKHLELLRKQYSGELTPPDVVNDARCNNSPLHSFFEWDDGVAAEHHRLAQARALIRSVVAIYVDTDKAAKRISAFIHIPQSGAPHYRATHLAMGKESTRAMVLQRAWRELQSWRRRYSDLKEFAALFEVADEVADHLKLKAS